MVHSLTLSSPRVPHIPLLHKAALVRDPQACSALGGLGLITLQHKTSGVGLYREVRCNAVLMGAIATLPEAEWFSKVPLQFFCFFYFVSIACTGSA